MSDIQLLEEEVFEFELNEDISVIYVSSIEAWFIEDHGEDDRMTLIEDTREDISLEKDYPYKGVIITVDQLDSYKKIVHEGIDAKYSIQ